MLTNIHNNECAVYIVVLIQQTTIASDVCIYNAYHKWDEICYFSTDSKQTADKHAA